MTPRNAQRLRELRTLPLGWYDGEGEPPTAASLASAEEFLELNEIDGRTAFIYPTPVGGIEIEWDVGICTIAPDGSREIQWG